MSRRGRRGRAARSRRARAGRGAGVGGASWPPLDPRPAAEFQGPRTGAPSPRIAAVSRRDRIGIVLLLLLAAACGWFASSLTNGGRGAGPAGPAGEDARDAEVATLKERL